MIVKIHHNKYNNENTQYNNKKLLTIVSVHCRLASYRLPKSKKIKNSHTHTSGNKIN